MALPPKGDPRRALHLAIRSTRVLGVMFVLFGTCSVVPFFIMGARGGRSGGPPPEFMAVASLMYFGPGVLFILLSVFLGQHKLWAVVSAIVLTCVCALFILVAALGLLMAASVSQMPRMVLLITLGICALLVAALGQLIYHLAKSFEAIKLPPYGRDERGFEPLMARPFVPQPQGPSYPPTPPTSAEEGATPPT